MKKITFMLIALLCTVVALAAGPKRQFDAQLTKPAKTQVQYGKQIAAKQIQRIPSQKVAPGKMQAPVSKMRMAAKARAKAAKAPSKAGIREVIEMLVGDNKMLISDYYDIDNETGKLVEAEPAMGGTPVSIARGDDENTIAISGFTSDATEAIEGTVELTEDKELLEQGIIATIAIEEGQTLLVNDTYGPVMLANATSDGDIIAYVLEDGTVYFYDIWFDYVNIEGNVDEETGELINYIWSNICASLIVPANGKMEWRNDEGKQSAIVYISQDPEAPKTATVFNFGNYETAIDVTMKEDQSFVIEKQLVFDGGTTQGLFYTYGLNDEESSLIELAGVGTETTLTFNSKWTLYSTKKYWIGSQQAATITITDGKFVYPFIPDVAATPADPTIFKVNPYNDDPDNDPETEGGYGSVLAYVPTVDVDGNEIKESKLYYSLYADVKGEITQITFSPDLYQNLTEEIAEVPYTLNDSWDFQQGTDDDGNPYKAIFLNFDFNSYDRIGIQSIYYGGDERHVTEIQWAEFEKPNPYWIAANQGYEDGQRVESITFSDPAVTGTLSAGENTSSSPTYYENGESLRLYATNTLTITSETPFSLIKFTMADDASAIQKKLEAEGYDADKCEWTGEATEVTFKVPAKTGLQAPQARIKRIDVYYVGQEPEVYEVVELPAGAEVNTWYITASTSESKLRGEEIGVAESGDDIYIQGLCPYLPEAWVKGTKSDNTVTFASGQYYGQYEYNGNTFDMFFVGANVDDEGNATIADVVFTIDEEAGTMTTDQYIFVNGKPSEIYFYEYYYDVVLSQEKPAEPEAIVVPEDLVAEAYHFKGHDVYYNFDETRAINVNVGFYDADGTNNVYIQGLSYYLNEAWVKGTIDASGVVTIPETFLGVIEDGETAYYITFSGATFTYDAATGTLTSAEGYTTDADNDLLDEYNNVVLTKIVETVAIPADPQITKYDISGEEYDPYVQFNVPIEDVNGNPMLVDKLNYVIWIKKDGGDAEVLTLNPDYYEFLEEEVSEIPYTYTDNYDIYYYKLYLNQDEEELASWTNIGIQSIYYGGDVRRMSNIIWLEGEPTGINNMSANNGKAVFYDLQGRKINANAKGLFIKQVLDNNGSMKTVKVVR